MGEVADSSRVFYWLVNDSRNEDCPQEIVSKLVYVYGYYPPGSKFVFPGSQYSQIIEQNRSIAITSILQTMREKTGCDFDDDIDQWVDAFGTEKTQDRYRSFKEFRINR